MPKGLYGDIDKYTDLAWGQSHSGTFCCSQQIVRGKLTEWVGFAIGDIAYVARLACRPTSDW